ncbi:DNA polymerase III subunit alpha [Mesomycoplasma molare]|uniref:DNA-directed DNA polymerase n=1 Tax=Mesomycoplasma molare TaxID=171288 RepID=A0ABY5TTV5_9BACT|nr:DNA polymerase III subunit alpha [Mesomycoplasma molare]UWD34102.1 DNA polymerase III subunit alpha [Mesomycoplasma molare]
MNNKYNLHNISEYSFLESTLTIKKMVEYAKKENIPFLSLTDRNSMFGIAYFLEECKSNGIKPIIGIDLDVENYRFIILAKNYEGFIHLSKLSSLYYEKKYINLSMLDNENIIVIDHPIFGYFAKNKEELNIKNYFISTNDLNKENSIFIKENRMFSKDENKVLESLLQISGKSLESNNFYNYFTEEVILDEIIKERIEKIIREIDIVFPKIRNTLPKFRNNLNLDSNTFLKKIVKENLKLKEEELKKYKDSLQRIKYELEIIENLGFADYFLIIWDLIKWAKEQGIFIGPGRGSVSGSLISYVLDITEVNPLKYDLYFERFLNPKRVSMPDIDIDIQDTRRDEVIKYLFNKYGEKNVALIATFQTLGAKMAFRDIARVKGISVSEVNEITKLFKNDISLEESYEAIPKIKAKINSNAKYLEVYNIAKQIEGLPRQHGTHAAGIVISNKEINNFVPTLYTENNLLETQFTMEHLENFGLLKIDLLGLKNLSVVKDILVLIKENLNLDIKFENVPTYNLKTNILLSQAKTNGIFQLESPGMKSTLLKVKVSSLDDVIAIISLFRPGPMENINVYAKRKSGLENISSISNEFDEIVKNTFGIIVYQEQIMKICQQISGMSFSDSDILRKAISKKNFNEIQPIKDKFFLGALSRGYDEQTAKNIFEKIEHFAEYGFNKAHAVAYAILAYKMAYLKTNYTLYFYSALLNNANGSHETIKKYVLEAKEMGYEIIAPDINNSTNNCVIDNNKIFLPLIMIKGLGTVATNKIIDIRKSEKFSSFFDFCLKMKLNNIGDSVIKILINSNTLREFGSPSFLLKQYNEILLSLDLVIDKENDEHKINTTIYEKLKENNLLFSSENNFIDKNEISLIQDNELNYLGMIFSKEKPNKYETDIKLENMHVDTQYVLPLRVISKKTIFDKNKNEMGILTLKDSSKTIDVFVFWKAWEKIKEIEVKKLYYFEIMKKNDKYYISKTLRELYE